MRPRRPDDSPTSSGFTSMSISSHDLRRFSTRYAGAPCPQRRVPWTVWDFPATVNARTVRGSTSILAAPRLTAIETLVLDLASSLENVEIASGAWSAVERSRRVGRCEAEAVSTCASPRREVRHDCAAGVGDVHERRRGDARPVVPGDSGPPGAASGRADPPGSGGTGRRVHGD